MFPIAASTTSYVSLSLMVVMSGSSNMLKVTTSELYQTTRTAYPPAPSHGSLIHGVILLSL